MDCGNGFYQRILLIITKKCNDKLYNIFIDDRAKLRYTVFVSKRLRKKTRSASACKRKQKHQRVQHF